MSAGLENAGKLFAAHVGSGRVAMVDLSRPRRPREITYDALDAACDAVAGGLRQAGLGLGDRAAILSHNRAEYAEAVFGAMRAGVAPVQVNVRLPPDAVRHILEDAGARLAFVDSEHRGLVPDGVTRVDFDGAGPDAYAAFRHPGPFEAIVPAEDTVALQPYTSGSTGAPKGVLLGHRGIYWMSRTAARLRRFDQRVAALVSAPMFHKNAMVWAKLLFIAGGRMVLLPRFDVERYIAAIGRYRCTLLTGVPTMFALMLRRTDLLAATDLSSVTHVGFGSAPGSDSFFDRLAETFPGVVIENDYGLTEGGPIMFCTHPDGSPRPRNSVGCVMAGAEVRLVGGASADEGVLQVRNPGVMLGYHNLPAATAERLDGGWLDTGDVLRRDDRGYYYFVGRQDDMFVTSGENVYPLAVETILERMEGVEQAAVVPVADAIKGQLPHAFVVERDGAGLSEAAVKAFALANGPAYAHPRRIHFVAELPVSGARKLDRKALIARAAELAGGGEAG